MGKGSTDTRAILTPGAGGYTDSERAAAAAARIGPATAAARTGGGGGRPTFAEGMFAAGYQPVPGSDDWFNPLTGDYY